MTQILFWGFLTLLCGGLIWAIAKISEATGEARAQRAEAERKADDILKGTQILIEPRTVDDTAGRLSGGTFFVHPDSAVLGGVPEASGDGTAPGGTKRSANGD